MKKYEQEREFLKTTPLDESFIAVGKHRIYPLILLTEYKAYLTEQAKKGKLTWQECKDKTGQNRGFNDWQHFRDKSSYHLIIKCMDEAAEMYGSQFIEFYSDQQYEVLKKHWTKALEINPPSKKEIYVITKHKGIYADKTVTTLKFFYSESEAEIYKNRLDKLYDKAYDFYNSWVERLGGLDQELPDDEFDHIDLILEKSQNYLEISLYIEKVILHT